MNPVRYLFVPQRVAQNENFTFGVAFHIFVVGNHRHFRFGVAYAPQTGPEMGVITSRDPLQISRP